MDKTKLEFEELRIIVGKVIERYLRFREKKSDKRTLIVLTDWITGFDDVKEYCEDNFDKDLTDCLTEKDFPPTGFKTTFFSGNSADERALEDNLLRYKKLTVISPSVQHLRSLVSTLPHSFSQKIILHMVLNTIPTEFVMDFDPLRLPAGRVSSELRHLIEDVADMGIKFTFPKEDHEKNRGPSLITADTVDEFHKNGKKLIIADKLAIVTPLAKERAQDLNIKIIKE